MPTYKKVIHADDNISELTNNSGYLTSVATANIGTGAVTAPKIASGAITVSKLGSQAVNDTAIKDEAVSGAKLASSAVSTAKIATEAVTAAKLASGCIDHPSKLANGVVGNAQIADSSVDRFKLASGAVRSANLDDLSVSTAKIQTDAVTSAKIADGAIITALLDNDSVSTSKIQDESVTDGKIADDAVSTGTIQDNAITEPKINNGAVQLYQIGTNNSGGSGDMLGVAGGGTGLFWQTKTSLASDLSTYSTLSKSYMHFCHNFYDDIGTTTHYLPWNTGNETTTTLSSNSSFCVADTMTLKKIMIRPMQFQTFSNYTLTVRVYKASNNSTSFAQQSTATMSFNQYSNYGVQTITSMNPTVVSGEHIAIYIDASSDPGGTIHWQATSVWEVDRIGL